MSTADKGPIRVAAVQTVSGGDVDANLAAVEPLIVAAKEQGAALVLLPEYFGIFGARATDKVDVREIDGRGPQQDFLSRMAREQSVWLDRRHRPHCNRRSDPGAQRLAGIRSAGTTGRALRQDPSVRVQSGR